MALGDGLPPLGAGLTTTARRGGRRGAQGSLTPNDDGAEKARNRQLSRMASMERRDGGPGGAPPGAGRAKGQPLPKQAKAAPAPAATLSVDQLLMAYGNCIKAAKLNKITKENTWSYELIDDLPKLVVPKTQDDGNGYHPVGNILDAARQLYEKRVDWLQTESFRVLGGLGRAQLKPGDEGAEEGADGAEGEGAADGAPKRARRSRAAQESNPKATLAAHAEDLNLKTHERARGSAKDPLLHKMSQIFDSTSADSMLYNNLPMYNGMEITFDSGCRPCVDASVSGDAADNVLNDPPLAAERLLPAWERASRAMAGAERICPSLDKLRFMCGDAPGPRAAEAARRAVRGWLEEDDEQVSAQADFVVERPPELEEMDLPAPDPAEEALVDLGDDLAAPDDLDDGDDWGDEDAAGTGPGLDERGIDLDWLRNLGEGRRSGGAFGLAYARPHFKGGHWKRASREGEAAGAGEPAKRAGSKKQHSYIDFENLPPVDPELFVRAKKNAEISKVDTGTRAIEGIFLPEDLHYQAARLGRLFLKPQYGLARGAGARRAAGGAAGALDPADDFDGGDWDAPDLDDDHGAFALPDAPVVGDGPAPLQFRLRKATNIKLLKATLLDSLHGVHGAGKSKKKTPTTGFQDVLSNIPTECAAGKAEDISVHMCFWGMLSLANERGLKITGVDTLDALTIAGR